MINYLLKPFKGLSTTELYEILALRQEVFIVEQDCPYLDADGKDVSSFHLLGRDEKDVLVAYARIVKKGISYDHYTSIGRVITSEKIRGKGEGYRLMKTAVEETISLWHGINIKISAQSHLVPFYTSCGFQSTGEEYLEDDIPHTSMIYRVLDQA